MMSPPSWEVCNTVILYYPPRKVFSLAGGLSSKAMHGPTLDIAGGSMVSISESVNLQHAALAQRNRLLRLERRRALTCC